ncbi:hypothetical protein KUV65_17600 [Maritalea mobilis]|uniref:hypothetical protein n=1 Tax=Maritalea mobilis TaxID=483324 RepID=UPI001C97C58D|nr:hypothetical protein [Maritalea mobilis]MBY6203188.1 hypothetical protein [Maritalea mobilis]
MRLQLQRRSALSPTYEFNFALQAQAEEIFCGRIIFSTAVRRKVRPFLLSAAKFRQAMSETCAN